LTTLSLSGERIVWKDSDLPDTRGFRLGDYSSDGAWLLISSDSGSADGSGDRDVWAVPHLGGPTKRLTQSAGTDAYPTWGPDRETVYYVSDGGRKPSETWGIWRVRIDRKSLLPKGPAAEVFTRNGSKVFHPRFVAGGRTLAYAVEEPNTRIWVSGSAAMENGTIAVRGQDPALSPDGQTVYFVGETAEQQGVFAIGRSGDKSSLRKITGLTPLATGFTSSGLSLSPDGQWMALFGYDGKRFGIFVAPTGGGDSRLVEELAAWDAVVPVWSPDGNWLAYTVDKQLVRVSRDGRVREPLVTLHRWQGWTIRWSPNGRHLAACANASTNEAEELSSVYVVSVADKVWKKLTPDSEDSKEKEGLEWHPGGEYLTYMFSGPEKFIAQIRRAYLNGRPTDLMFDQLTTGITSASGRPMADASSSPVPRTTETKSRFTSMTRKQRRSRTDYGTAK
jgi:Tol biopolymer transport system component